jgi:hypothetical protein
MGSFLNEHARLGAGDYYRRLCRDHARYIMIDTATPPLPPIKPPKPSRHTNLLFKRECAGNSKLASSKRCKVTGFFAYPRKRFNSGLTLLKGSAQAERTVLPKPNRYFDSFDYVGSSTPTSADLLRNFGISGLWRNSPAPTAVCALRQLKHGRLRFHTVNHSSLGRFAEVPPGTSIPRPAYYSVQCDHPTDGRGGA